MTETMKTYLQKPNQNVFLMGYFGAITHTLDKAQEKQ